jgi:hypothetical protein
MIWCTEEISVPGQPAAATVRLVGSYSPEEHPSVKIYLQVSSQPDLLLYSHHPSGLAHEEPTADQVLDRYRSKLYKLKQRVQKTPFLDLRWVKPLC